MKFLDGSVNRGLVALEYPAKVICISVGASFDKDAASVVTRNGWGTPTNRPQILTTQQSKRGSIKFEGTGDVA